MTSLKLNLNLLKLERDLYSSIEPAYFKTRCKQSTNRGACYVTVTTRHCSVGN